MTASRAALLAALVLAVSPRHADAQIYAWRDANGTLVLSDRKLDAPADVYEVEGAPAYRSTKPAASSSARERYEPLVQEYASRQSLRPELVRAVIQVESGFNPFATSPKGAMGLMQLMPQTARELGVTDPYDPEQNIRGGTRYLRELLDKYQGDEELALAAYNAGPGAVDKYGRQVPPYAETENYVKKVGTAASRSRDAQATGTSGAAVERPGRRVIYKTIEIIDGRAVPRYSVEQPLTGTYEILQR